METNPMNCLLQIKSVLDYMYYKIFIHIENEDELSICFMQLLFYITRNAPNQRPCRR